MANCGRYRQVSGIGSLWKCSGVKLWTIHSLAVWKPFWKTMESASWAGGRSPKKKGWGFISVDAYLKI